MHTFPHISKCLLSLELEHELEAELTHSQHAALQSSNVAVFGIYETIYPSEMAVPVENMSIWAFPAGGGRPEPALPLRSQVAAGTLSGQGTQLSA
jgi:hypothetical protein